MQIYFNSKNTTLQNNFKTFNDNLKNFILSFLKGVLVAQKLLL